VAESSLHRHSQALRLTWLRRLWKVRSGYCLALLGSALLCSTCAYTTTTTPRVDPIEDSIPPTIHSTHHPRSHRNNPPECRGLVSPLSSGFLPFPFRLLLPEPIAGGRADRARAVAREDKRRAMRCGAMRYNTDIRF
jgi:hypothetical protein